MADTTNTATKLAQISITQFFSRVNGTDTKVLFHGSVLVSVNSDRNQKADDSGENLETWYKYIIVNTQYKTICCFTSSLDLPSLIPVNSDSNLKRLAQNINNLELDDDIHFAARIGFKIIILARKDPNHWWFSRMNFNEGKYAVHLCKDDKSRVLFDNPIVWPVTHLVLIMDQVLTGPGI